MLSIDKIRDMFSVKGIEDRQRARALSEEKRGELSVVIETGVAIKPLGDFMAGFGAILSIIFVALNFFRTGEGELIKGYQTPYGIMLLVVGAICLIIAMSVLLAKFIFADLRLARSPGWFYAAAAFCMVVITVAGMVLGYHGYELDFGLYFSLGAGMMIGVATLMKF